MGIIGCISSIYSIIHYYHRTEGTFSRRIFFDAVFLTQSLALILFFSGAAVEHSSLCDIYNT